MKAFAAIASATLLGGSTLITPGALANDNAKINARIAAGGSACKNAVAARFQKSTMATINVELGATLQQSIEAGTTTLKDIQESGLSFNWTFKKHSGYCNTDGGGNVVEFKQL